MTRTPTPIVPDVAELKSDPRAIAEWRRRLAALFRETFAPETDGQSKPRAHRPEPRRNQQ